MEFIKNLNWSQNWFWYILVIIGAIMIVRLLIKNLLANMKKIIRMIIIVIIMILIIYILHLAGVLSFDILKLFGLEEVSGSIKDFFGIMKSASPKGLNLLNSNI